MTLRAKVGLSFERSMIYLTAGPALAKMNYSDTETLRGGHVPTAPLHASFNSNVGGYVAGAGLEYKLKEHLSFKAEYMYVNTKQQDAKWYRGSSVVNPGSMYNVYWKSSVDAVRVGLNYSF